MSNVQIHIAGMMSITLHFREMNPRAWELLLMNALQVNTAVIRLNRLSCLHERKGRKKKKKLIQMIPAVPFICYDKFMDTRQVSIILSILFLNLS